MASNNLTERQKTLLNWLVQEVRSGKLEEDEIWIFQTFEGTGIAGYAGNVPEIKTTTLQALDRMNYLTCDFSQKNLYKCSLTKLAYEAFDDTCSTVSKSSDETVSLAHSSRIITLEKAIQFFQVSPLIQRYDTWAVTTYGVECG
ncbi:hypothetical protein [Leptolyngbya sp. FACHB-1624]|uniref:hypothetical protein n=1 Tax=Leptolyngbya sp. FACHB-1624 TaxID=2692802 RepID=UPI0039ED384B